MLATRILNRLFNVLSLMFKIHMNPTKSCGSHKFDRSRVNYIHL